MANNPQKENGYTALANEIRDELFLRELKPTHRDILELIWRVSYGCKGRKFVYVDNYKYFEIIGIKKGHVKERIDYLVNNKVLMIIKEFNVIVFNKYFDEWTIPKVTDYDKRKLLLKELISINLSYQFSNTVTDLVTSLRTNGNDVTKKRERLETETLTRDSVSIMPKERFKESIKESDDECKNEMNISAILKTYEENGFGLFAGFIVDEVGTYMDEGRGWLVVEALKEAKVMNKVSWKYAKTCLNNWISAGIKTARELEAHKQAFKQQKSGYVNTDIKKKSEDKKQSQYKDLSNYKP